MLLKFRFHSVKNLLYLLLLNYSNHVLDHLYYINYWTQSEMFYIKTINTKHKIDIKAKIIEATFAVFANKSLGNLYPTIIDGIKNNNE